MGQVQRSPQEAGSAALEDEAAHEWAEANGALRSELGAAVARFRAECAPLAGPEVTVRGRVVASPRAVPVDPAAYQVRVVRETFGQVRPQLVEVWGTMASTMAQAMGQVLQTLGPTQAAFALVDEYREGENDDA